MTGSGSYARPLALLIPGLDGTGKLYYRQTASLSASHRVTPWYFRIRSDFELADLTHELAAETAGEPPGSVLVVAESFGGLVALDFVLQFPERVRCLVLINSFPYFRRRLRIRLARVLALLLRLRLARQVKGLVVDCVLKAEGIPREDRDRYREIIRHVDAKAYRCRLRLIQEADLRPRLQEIRIPTLLLACGRDKLVPSVREARFMQRRIPQAQVREFPKAGHALLLTPGFYLADCWQEILPVNPSHPGVPGVDEVTLS